MQADLMVRTIARPAPGDIVLVDGVLMFLTGWDTASESMDAFKAYLVPQAGDPIGPAEVSVSHATVIGRMDPHDWTADFARLARLEFECRVQRAGRTVIA